MKTIAFASAAVLALSLGATPPAAAEGFPERPVRLVVPFAPGGMSDTTARIFQRTIEEEGTLGQPITVINMGGGGATIGSRNVKDSDPDGHTIMLIHLAVLSAHALGVADYGLDAFEPVAQTGSSCLVLTAGAETPYQTLEDVFEAARAAPGTIPEAVNLGAVVHIASLVLADAAGVSFRYVQTGGGAERIQAVMGGHTELSLFSTSEFKSFEPMGIRPLAILQEERHSDFPDIPTAAEQGYDVTFCIDNWWFAPAGTPQDRIDVIADALEAAMDNPAVQEAFASHTLSPTFLRGEALRAHMEAVEADIVAAAAKAQQ